MIVKALSILLFLIFCILAGFHFYWLLGGRWGSEKVIPTKDKSVVRTPPPPKFATLIVAVGLLSIGLHYLLKGGFIETNITPKLLTYISWIIPSLFLIRAVGEFKYVGFFKKIKDTEFAKADSKIFSPLCLFIAVTGFVIQYLT